MIYNAFADFSMLLTRATLAAHFRLLNDFRLALKAFTDQKRRFFPHLDNGLETNEPASKKRCGSEEITMDPKEEISFLRTLPDILKSFEKDVPNLKILTFERLDWLKRASTLTSSTNESSLEHNYHGSNKLRLGSVGTVSAEKVAVIELLFPSVFRAVISLHPAGSIDPDAVAFFSPDEVYLAILPCHLSLFLFPNIRGVNCLLVGML